MSEELRKALQANGFDILNRSPHGVQCFIPAAGGDVDVLARRVQKRGRCWITVADFEGVRVLRACVTNFRTGPDDVAILVGELKAVVS